MGFDVGSFNIMQGLGVGMSMMGAYRQGVAQQGAINYEAQVAQNNAKIAEYQASQEKIIGEQQEQTQRLKTAQVFGDQRAAMAANGVDLGEGSPNEVLATTKFTGERDALTIRDNAARRAWAYQNNAAGYTSEAAADRAASGSINPLMAAGTSLLTSGSTVASNWYKYNQSINGKG